MGLCRQSRTQRPAAGAQTHRSCQCQWQRFLSLPGCSLGSNASSGQVTPAVSSHGHQPSPGWQWIIPVALTLRGVACGTLAPTDPSLHA